MRAGVRIEEDELMYHISCSRCKGALAFPAKIDLKDAKMKAQTRHGWKLEGKKLYCEGCSDLLDEPKKSTPKSQPEKQSTDDGDDEYIELGE